MITHYEAVPAAVNQADFSLKLLIVDDQVSETAELCQIIRELGHQITGIAQTVAEALALLDEQQPDLVLLNYCLNESPTGTELTRILRDTYQLPFIFLSSHFDDSPLAETTVSESYGHIYSPFQPKDIDATLQLAHCRLAHRREARLRTENQVLLDIAESIASIRDKVELLKVILEKVQPLFDADDVGLGVIDAQENTLTDLAVLFPTIADSAVNVEMNANQNAKLFLADSLLGQVIQNTEEAGGPVIVDLTPELAQQWPEATYLPIEIAHGLKQTLFTTLKVGDKLIGTFNLNGRNSNHFQHYSLYLFQAIADLIAVAVSNILANEEILEREREKTLLLSISEAIATVRSKEDILRLIVQKVKPLFKFYDCGILIINANNRYNDLTVLHPKIDNSPNNYVIQNRSYYDFGGIDFAGSHLEWLVSLIEQAQAPILFDWQADYTRFHDAPLLENIRQLGYTESLVSTLKIGGTVFGCFFINYMHSKQVQSISHTLFQNLTNQLSVAISNILANEEILEREREKTKLLEISEAIAQVKSTDNLLKLIIDKIKPLFRFHDCGLFIINTTTQTHTDLAAVLPDVSPSEWNEQIALVSKNVPHPGSPVEWMMAEIDKANGPVLCDFQELANRFPDYPQFENTGSMLVEMGYRDCLTTNLKVRGQSIGMFCINALQKDFFIPAQFPFFQSVANGVSIAVANILANEELERKTKEKTLQLATLQLINQLPAVSSYDAQVTTLLQIAQEIDRVMPFDMLVSNTFFNNLHFLSSCFEISKQAGIFRPLPERESFRSRQRLQLHQLTETQLPMAELFRRPGVYVGQAFADICANYPNPKLAHDTYGIQSVMYVPLRIFGREAGTIILASREPLAFTTDQLRLVEEVFAQLAMAIENILVCEDLNQREQEKSLQLALNNTLVNLKAPDQLSQTLACEVNRIVPFEGFNLRIYRPHQQVSYHTYLYRGNAGEFSETLPYLLVQSQFKLAEMEQLSATNGPSGLYDGESYRQFCARHDLYQFISQQYAFQSLMVFHLPLAQGNWATLALWSAQPSAFKTYHFDLLSGLLPQVSLALENLLSFDDLHRRDEQKATQLAISNILLTQQSPRILPDIAAVLNQSLSCDFCCLLASPEANTLEVLGWGAIKASEEFIALTRTEFLKQAGLTDQDYDQQVQANVTELATAQLVVGDSFDALLTRQPLARALVGQTGTKSLIYQPLSVQGVHSVTLVIGSRRAYSYTSVDLETTHEVALQMGLAMENRLAFAEIERLKGQLEQENVYLQDELKISYNFDEIVGESPVLSHVFDQVRMVSPTDSTVLIEGETGTGKELIARAIHNYSPRRTGILVKVNCAALPANLIESELFGHEKGAFTGALERRIGKFELANGGTLFLDEIGELPLELQAKLLRAIQEREIERVGGKSTVRIDVRIVAATNKNLAQESKAGTFRTDLYYRLNVFPILLPPLRQRRDDIPLLATHFARKFARKMGKKLSGLSSQALQQLMTYDFPGNIRELEHIIEHAVIVAQGNRLALGRPLTNADSVVTTSGDGDTGFVIKTLHHHERDYILQVLKYTGGRIRGTSGAAELMGIHPNTLESRMQKLGIHKAFVM